MLRTPLPITALLAMAAVCMAQEQASSNLVHVEINGLHSDKGQVMCALFSSAAGYPKDYGKAIGRTNSEIVGTRAVCEFSAVSPGTYAVAVFHDENLNGKLETKFMGIPREGVGASNNAKGHFGPPKFDAAAFRFSGGRMEIKIQITYL